MSRFTALQAQTNLNQQISFHIISWNVLWVKNKNTYFDKVISSENCDFSKRYKSCRLFVRRFAEPHNRQINTTGIIKQMLS